MRRRCWLIGVLWLAQTCPAFAQGSRTFAPSHVISATVAVAQAPPDESAGNEPKQEEPITSPGDAGAELAKTSFTARLADKLESSLRSGKFVVALPFALLGGMLLALTPCVLPMVPIVVQVLVGREDATPAQRVLATVVYTLGLSLVYAVLGLVAALTGGLVGGVLQNAFVLAGFVLFFVLMALSMFGVYELEMPAGLRDKLQVRSKGDLLSAFLMGLLSGLIASPCIGPVIAGVLGWIASTKNAALGFSMLFAMGVGLGTPFIIAAIAGGTLLKPGAWMDKVKKFLGLLLLVGAAYFADLAAGEWKGLAALGAACILLVVIGAVLFVQAKGESMRRLRTAGVWQTGLWGLTLAVAFGLVVVRPGPAGQVTPTEPGTEELHIAWREDVDAALELAQSQGKPAFIDFTARWCIPCREMEATTFADPDVIKETGRFIAIRADLTERNDPKVRALQKRFRIFGPPVIIFADSSGKILKSDQQRVVGLIGPEEFLRRMRQVN